MGISDFFISVESLPQNGYGFVQLLFLGAVYSHILMYASHLISDGSELLLLVPSLAGIVGSVVLPVLGAVPDGCIVLFSGIGPNAQEQLTVGVGAFVGSTIMLLTIPWFLSIVWGRVNIDVNSRTPRYRHPKLDPPAYLSLSETGVSVTAAVRNGSIIMLLTSLTYLLLQIPGASLSGMSRREQIDGERNWALVGSFLCVILFVAYLGYQYQLSKKGLDTSLELARQEYVHDAIIAGKISLLGVMTDELANCGDFQNEAVPGGYQSISTEDQVRKIENSVPAQAMDRLDRLLKPFFRAYDLDNNNTLSVSELTHVFRDLGERLTEEELEAVFVDMDTDKSGAIDYKEFVHGTAHYIITQNLHLSANKIGRNKRLQSKSIDPHAVHQLKAVLASEGEEDEEHEEVPEDIKDLSPEEQQRRIKFRSAWMMTLGTVIVLVISDPVVEVLGEIGKRTGVPAFYISFLLAPLASNAAELIAVYNYSRKKTAKTVTISLATLQGAVVMNNTFVLGIFMVLIWTQGLVWDYLAETLAILIVQLFVGLYALKSTHNVADGLVILSLYPLSLLLIILLEHIGWN